MSIETAWLRAFEASLMRLVREHPNYHRTRLRELAKVEANAAEPEGFECIRARALSAIRRDAAGLGSYEAEVGRRIIGGMTGITLRLLGRRGARAAVPIAEVTAPAEPPAPALAPTPVVYPAVRGVRRPTLAEFDQLVQRYCDYAEGHNAVPSDTALATFSDWGTATWARVRHAAEGRGYGIEVVNKSVTFRVTRRPTAAENAEVLRQRVEELEALLGLRRNDDGR